MGAATTTDEGREALLRRGTSVGLPGMLALAAAESVRLGEFADLEEFMIVAVGSYLDMRRHPDVSSLLQLRLLQESIESSAIPRSFEQGRADVLARLDRPAPMTAREAVAALG